jgi:hypothetical protein
MDMIYNLEKMTMALFPRALIRIMFSLMVLLSILFINPAFSQDQVNITEENITSDPCEGSEDDEYIHVGGVSGTGSYGPTASVDVDLGGSVGGGKQSTVTSSIKKLRSGRCQTVFNNSSECNGYSISFSIIEYDLSDKEKRINSGSFSINTGKTKVVPFSCKDKKNYRVEISSFKVLKRNK